MVRFDDALPPLLFDAICKFVLNLTARGVPRGTFWQPFEAKPTTCIAAAASVLSELLPATQDCAGVEWWVRSSGAHVPMALHFDKDETRARTTAEIRHPVYSGVIYIKDGGGPTLIVDQMLSEETGALVPSEPECAILSYPCRNSFLAFPGHLRHGVIAGSESSSHESSNSRCTLLLNWWRTRPASPSCSDLEADHWYSRFEHHAPQQRKLAVTPVGLR